MYIAILSDFHLNPGKINSSQLNWLKKVYSQPQIQQVIINGDLVEMYQLGWGPQKFDTFVKIWFPSLVPIFSQKPSIIISGNHDPYTWYDRRIYRLCQKFVQSYRLKIKNHSYLITHGHQYTLGQMPKNNFDFLLFHTPIILTYKLIPKLINYTFGRFFNLKTLAQKPQGIKLIIGHTHAQTIDPKQGFYNSGVNFRGQQQGLLIHTQTGLVSDIHTLL